MLIILINTSFAKKINKSYCQNFIYELLTDKDSDSVISPYVFIISKKNAKLYLYLNKDVVTEGPNTTNFIKSYNVATGKVLGKKLLTGDKKTPEGVYFANRFLDLSYFQKKGQVKKYGGFAISLSYPSPVDKLEKHSGGGIWIHGTNEESRIAKQRDSKGCIVVKNKYLKELATFVLSNLTPVIIYKDAIPKMISFKPNKQIQTFINNWRKSWEEKDIKSFTSFYSEKYYNFKTKENKERFIKKKTYLAKRYKKISVKIEKPSFYYSPTYSVIQFKQIYKSTSYYSEGIKNLYLKKENGKYKILTESFVKDSSVKYWPCKK